MNLAKRNCDIDGYNDPAKLDTLAAAFAEEANFNAAVQTAEKARDLALSSAQNELADKIRSHLELYKASKPLHEQP